MPVDKWLVIRGVQISSFGIKEEVRVCAIRLRQDIVQKDIVQNNAGSMLTGKLIQ